MDKNHRSQVIREKMAELLETREEIGKTNEVLTCLRSREKFLEKEIAEIIDIERKAIDKGETLRFILDDEIWAIRSITSGYVVHRSDLDIELI